MRIPKPLPQGLLGAAILLGALALMLAAAPVPGGARRAGPLATPQWGPDIRVNPLASATPNANRNFSLAVDPTDPNHVVASYDNIHSETSFSGYSWSTNGGRTWQGGLLEGRWLTGTVSIPSGNVSVDFDGHGTAYYLTQATGDISSGYFVLTSTLGNAWSTPVPIVATDYSVYRDQARLVVDRRLTGPFAGSIYLIWRYFPAGFGGLQFRYSRDQGRTWSADIPITDPGHEFCAGPMLAVAADGSIYAVFVNDPRSNTELYLDRSTDGGMTWGTDRLIGGGPITKTGVLDWKTRLLGLFGNAGEGVFLVHNNPSMAVAPDDPNTIYVVWNDGRWDQTFTASWGQSGRHGDIAFTRSTDAGVTWSPPARLNDDAPANGIDQFHPTVAAAPGGRVSVTWLDRRDNPTGYLYNLYYSESTDNGLTWSPNERVSDLPSDPMAVFNPKGEGVLGEYNALVYGPDYILPSWIDTRRGYAQDFFTDRGTFIPPTPVPTRSATATATTTAPAGASATRTVMPSPTPTLCATTFTDVPATAYFAVPVRWLACRQIVVGYTCGGPGEPCDPQQRAYFRPYTNTTRGQLSKMVVLGLGWTIQTPPTPTFADVAVGYPFYPYIETAAAHNVISGYTCGGPGEPCDPGNRPYFRPGNNVTRGQLSKIIVTAKGWGVLIPPTPTFADVAPTDPFYGVIERAVEKGLISGYTCGGPGEPCDPGNRPYFRTGNQATRGQLSKILYTALTQP